MLTATLRHRKHALLTTAFALLTSLVLLAGNGQASGGRGACKANASRHDDSVHPVRGLQDRNARCKRLIARAPRKGTQKPKPVPGHDPDPVPTPEPAPEPGPEPAPEPSPEPDPEPSPEPEPTPTPEPEAEPDPEAEPESMLAPAPELETAALAAATRPPLYWGAWIKGSAGEAPWSMTAATNFEQLLGKKLSLIHWSSPFYLGACNGYCTFQTPQFQAVRNHGSIPFFSWNPGPGTGAYTDAAIAGGSQDAYIKAWALAAKKWGQPFFLRFAWEMNGSWFPWGVGYNGTTAADYVAMWRHVHDIFTAVGATNATWVWCPNIDPYNRRAPMASVYPGASYVDWTCLDGYNGTNPWASFKNLFKSSYDQIVNTIAPGKPMAIGEVASTEYGGIKADWIKWMANSLPTSFPSVRGLLWFDKQEAGPGGHSDWPVESSNAASSAFAAALQSGPFVGNTYGNISTSPIPVP
jgi:hypothetical protein